MNYSVPGVRAQYKPWQPKAIEYAADNMCCFIADCMGAGKTLEALAAVQKVVAFPCIVVCPPKAKVSWAREVHKYLPKRTVEVIGLSPRAMVSAGLDPHSEVTYTADITVVSSNLMRLPYEVYRRQADYRREKHKKMPWGIDHWVCQNGECNWRGAEKLLKSTKAGESATGKALLIFHCPACNGVALAPFEGPPYWQLLKRMKPQALIVDESHHFKSDRSLRGEAVQTFAQGIPMRLCLTGTPILNRPFELINQIEILGRMKELGGFWGFCEDYTNMSPTLKGWDFSGVRNPKELNQKMRSIGMYIRRTKKQIMPFLPPVTPQTIPIPMEGKAATDYEWAERDFIDYMLKNYEKEYDEKAWFTGLAKLEILKQLALQAKMGGVIEWVEDWIESNLHDKLIIFAHHKDAQKRMLAICNYVLYERWQEANKGKTKAGVALAPKQYATSFFADDNDAHGNADKFQTDPLCRIIVCSMSAARENLTLTAATAMMFVEFDWVQANMDQNIARAYGRANDPHGLMVYYLPSAGSIEEDILWVAGDKAIVAQAVTDGKIAKADEWRLERIFERIQARNQKYKYMIEKSKRQALQ